MSGGDDDETTSSRGKPPRAPIVPERPTIPQLGRVATRRGVEVSKARAGEPDPLDDGPTTFDPGLPAGMREQVPASERSTEPRPAARPIHDEDEPTGASVPRETVIGKRPKQKQTIKPPNVAPVPPLDPRELPTSKHKPPVRFDPHHRIDDSSRTNKWDAPEEPPHRDSGPPTNPLPPRSPQLPLAPGPLSAPIHAVSMKTPHEVDEDRSARPLPEVRIRAMSELNQAPARGMGYLAPPAPPHDLGEERSRRRRDLVIWGSVAVIVAAVVMLVVWFVAR